MPTFYLVFVTFCGDINYGIDEEMDLVGIYSNLDEANAAVDKYNKSPEPFAPNFYFEDSFGDTMLVRIDVDSIEEDEKEKYTPVRCCDGIYC